jgi:hypothetical protein
MRFLDLDLDFFLNDNPYHSGSDGERLGSEYKPWNVLKVRHFLEKRCSLSYDNPIPGRTVKNHDTVIDFWVMLIKSGGLYVPFEVIHIDAHPDVSVQGGLYLKSGLLHIDPKPGLATLDRERVHPGNYLTYALSKGWLASLVWVALPKTFEHLPKGYSEEESGLRRIIDSPIGKLHIAQSELGVPFKILPWHKFRTSQRFDCMALSRSPNFTPPESDALVPVIEEYMTQI